MNDPKIGHVSAGVGELIPTGRDQWEVKKLQGWGLNEVPPPVLKSVKMLLELGCRARMSPMLKSLNVEQWPRIQQTQRIGGWSI